MQSASWRLDARLSNYLRPFRNFCPELGSTLFRRIADRLEAQRCQPLLHIRQRDELDDLLMEKRDDFLGGSGWDDHGEPRLALDVGIASFRHGWQVRQRPRSHF